MALTFAKEKDLDAVGLVAFYEDKKYLKLWSQKARNAFDYAAGYIPKDEVRPDDVREVLRESLEVCEEFRSFLSTNKLRQKYWKDHFAELILDREWDALTS